MDRMLEPRARRTLAIVAAASGLSVAVAGGAGALTQVQRPASWDVAEVAPGGRGIDIYYAAGGCKGDARGTARETATTVTLTVRQPVTEGGVCTADFILGTTRVRLAAPLAGRAIKGRPAPTTLAAEVPRRVPRLVGFSPWEARRVLRVRGMAASVRRSAGGSGLARVVAQSPAAGATLARGATVRLRVARR